MDWNSWALSAPSAVYRNLTPAHAGGEARCARGEGTLSSTPARWCVNTGKYTGRSPNDKFIVDTAGVHDEIAWGKVNRPHHPGKLRRHL